MLDCVRQSNINCSIEESLERFKPIAEAAKVAKVKMRGYISCVTDCPYDGETSPEQVAWVAQKLIDMGCYEISLGDTIGQATPEKINKMLDAVLGLAGPEMFAGHYHDTSGRACDNVEVSIAKGLRVFDAAVGGLGGCPYAPGAQGNVASEAVHDRVVAMGMTTGLDREILERGADMARAMRIEG